MVSHLLPLVDLSGSWDTPLVWERGYDHVGLLGKSYPFSLTLRVLGSRTVKNIGQMVRPGQWSKHNDLKC